MPGASPWKDIAAAAFFGELHPLLGLAPAVAESNLRLERAAEYIAAHCAQSLRLEDISREAGLSASYLIRAFKQRYGVTPHGFLLSQRVSLARRLVRGGLPLAQVAQDAGFSDQAHLQKCSSSMSPPRRANTARARPVSTAPAR